MQSDFYPNFFSFRDVEDFELNDDIYREHLLRLEEIENALDAEFGTVDSAKDGSECGENEDTRSENYCLVCEKAFKTRSVIKFCRYLPL